MILLIYINVFNAEINLEPNIDDTPEKSNGIGHGPEHGMCFEPHGGLKTGLLCYLNNAVTFTEQGQINLSVQVADEAPDSLLLRFEVRDTGIGIAPEVLPRLFNIFEQADNSQKRKYGGTGVGLALVRKLAVAMGGEAGCDSQVGQGSTFWFSARLKKTAETQA